MVVVRCYCLDSCVGTFIKKSIVKVMVFPYFRLNCTRRAQAKDA